VQIRRARPADAAAIAEIIVPTFRDGCTYAIDMQISEADAVAYWLAPDKHTFVAEEAGMIVGTYYLRANYAGNGSHVCNCGYMTRAGHTGRGIARALCRHSLEYGRAAGYRAMQFNYVVSTNERAVRLWQSMGFEIIGRLPGAFRHPTKGFVDSLVMYQSLLAAELPA
jgi:ribosomal protein S18 acetylase RimI-like enzyme